LAGALLERALEVAASKLYRDSESATAVQRRADALGLIAESALRSGLDGTGGRGDRFQVVVHVDAEALRADSEAGQSVLADGVRVSAETSRRLAGDASRVIMVHDANGRVREVSRRSRTVPVAIRRALETSPLDGPAGGSLDPRLRSPGAWCRGSRCRGGGCRDRRAHDG
jgi:hypothetical protein